MPLISRRVKSYGNAAGSTNRGPPMTYSFKGRQYVAIAIGSNADTRLVAFSLPQQLMYSEKVLTSGLLFGLLVQPAVSAPLNAEEQKIVATVTPDEHESAALLKQLVDINSGTLSLAGVHATG